MRTLVQCSLLSLFAACFNPAWAVQTLQPINHATPNNALLGLGPKTPAPVPPPTPDWQSPAQNQIFMPGSVVHFQTVIPLAMVTEKAPAAGHGSHEPLQPKTPVEPWHCCEVQQGHFENGMWQDGSPQIWSDVQHPGHDRAWSDFSKKGEKHIRARMYKNTGERGSWSGFRVFSVIDNGAPPAQKLLGLISPPAGAAFGPGSMVHFQANVSSPAALQNEGWLCCEVQGMTFTATGWEANPITIWNDLLSGHDKAWNTFTEKGLKKIQARLYKPNSAERSDWTPVLEYQIKEGETQAAEAAQLMPKNKP